MEEDLIAITLTSDEAGVLLDEARLKKIFETGGVHWASIAEKIRLSRDIPDWEADLLAGILRKKES